MPSLSEQRAEKIQLLVEWATKWKPKYIFLYDRILEQTRLMWPSLTEETYVSYARAALRIIKHTKLLS